MGGKPRLRHGSVGVALSRLAALVVVFVGSAAASATGRWLAPQVVGHSGISFVPVNSPFVPNETQPALTFDRSGTAGLAFVDGVSTVLAERPPGGRFSSPVLLAAGSGGVVNPLALAFPTNGETVALLHVFEDVGRPPISHDSGPSECCDQLVGLVRPAHGSPQVQTLRQLGPYQGPGGLYSAGATLLPVAGGLLAVTGAGEVWELANGATEFDRLSDLTAIALGRSMMSVAADGVGGAFATWETSDETSVQVTGPVTVYVAYKAPGHSFGPPVQTPLGPAGSVVGPDFVSPPLIAAWGGGRAALAWVLETPTNRSDSGSARVWNQHLQVAFRGRHHMGHPHTLAVVRHAPVVESLTADAILVDRTGAPTLAWTDCTALTCSVEVAVSRRAATVGKRQVLDRDATPWPGLSIAGDRRGDEVAAWWSSRGLKAATRRAGSVRFGRAKLLLRQIAPIDGGLSTPPPDTAFGPRGEAIVAWLTDAGDLEADTYRLPH